MQRKQLSQLRHFSFVVLTFIFGAIRIVKGALSMFHVLVIVSHISRPILELICPLLDKIHKREIKI